MTLVRAWDLPVSVKQINPGPCSGGRFLALEHAHDMPTLSLRVSYHDPSWLLRHGDLWMRNLDGGEWEKVKSLSQLKGFREEWLQDEDLKDFKVILPYPPEFYFVPRSARGRAHMERSRRKAFRQ